MDQSNYADILAQARTEDDKNKVDMLMNISQKGQNISIPDPYYGGDEGFTKVYRMIKEAGEELVNRIRMTLRLNSGQARI